ncbi:hypothetical protein HL658_09830 [Azospirillum sp. RWY-5-1]|uniref:HTH cro/C1-type domain-containing protein n=1 Tax=Azospirillum oleiclasticum TaxID=2735135 RepID=A0ABX2T747_9PROT|nr:helix-turn-helix domain-containing protein [Azospirillum oleiclasticum]NYZ12851.1 hypothetical protein [Azospirillum oleiclasticum]NYZ20011.1 hypothetical protein [Azospirillum oleiclasticum]
MSSSVGERLEAVRKALGETQKSMSTRYGLGESTWQTLERDGRLPKTETLTRLAADGVSIDWLVTGDGPMMRGPSPAGPTDTAPETPTPGPVVLTADAKEWRAMLITVLRTCQEEGLDMRDAVPEKFADIVDVMIEISKTVPDTGPADVSIAKRPSILKRIASLLLP